MISLLSHAGAGRNLGGVDVSVICWPTAYYLLFTELTKTILAI
jgi:hypothetical protein